MWFRDGAMQRRRLAALGTARHYLRLVREALGPGQPSTTREELRPACVEPLLYPFREEQAMRRWLASGSGLVMMVATIASAPVTSDEAHYVDAVGDANGLSGYVGELDGDHNGADTRPLSLDGADVVAAWFSTAYAEVREVDEDGRTLRIEYVPTALQLHVQTAGAASPSFGPTVSYDFYGRIGGHCFFGVSLNVQGPASTAYELGDGAILYNAGSDCPSRGRHRTAQLTFAGTTMTATFPFVDTLVDGHQLAPLGATITDDGGSYGGYVYTVHGDPSGISNEGKTIDVMNPPRPYRIGEDVPPNVDCVASPTPACA